MKNLENIYPHTVESQTAPPSDSDWVTPFKADTTSFTTNNKQIIFRDISELLSIIN